MVVIFCSILLFYNYLGLEEKVLLTTDPTDRL